MNVQFIKFKMPCNPSIIETNFGETENLSFAKLTSQDIGELLLEYTSFNIPALNLERKSIHVANTKR